MTINRSRVKLLLLRLGLIVVILLLIGLAIYWRNHSVKAAVEQLRATSLPRYRLKWEIDLLHRELVSLRSRLEKRTGVTPLNRPEVAPMSEAGYASMDDTLAALYRIRQDLADLALTANALDAQAPKPPPTLSNRTTLTKSVVSYPISITGSIVNRSLTLRNLGSEIIVNPQLIVNGEKGWFSADAILQEVGTATMSDRDKAVALWRFMVDNRFHGLPLHHKNELNDPVRYLNVYGYGFCGNSAKSLVELAEKAGLPGRVWGLEGHVVAEIKYDGSWHLFDPDGEIYYLEDDGTTIAGLETLEQRPDIVRKYPTKIYPEGTEKIIPDFYSSTANNQLVQIGSRDGEPPHTMAYSLRPGESLMRSWDNWGLYFASEFLQQAVNYGNGRFIFQPIFERELYQKGAHLSSGLTVLQEDGKSVLSPASSDLKGVLSYRFQSPYPYLAANLEFKGTILEGGSIAAAFSRDGQAWQTIAHFEPGKELAAALPLRGFFPNGHGTPLYEYWIRLTLVSGPAGPTSLRSVRYTSDIQLAPHALPTLKEGSNSVFYRDDNSGERTIEVLFEFDPKTDH